MRRSRDMQQSQMTSSTGSGRSSSCSSRNGILCGVVHVVKESLLRARGRQSVLLDLTEATSKDFSELDSRKTNERMVVNQPVHRRSGRN